MFHAQFLRPSRLENIDVKSPTKTGLIIRIVIH